MANPSTSSGYQPGGAAGITGVTSPHQGLGAAYAVSLPLFEGPLDLLLHLIEQEKLDINEISLVAVTDQYLKTIDQLVEVAPGALADFLVVASRLLYIKSTRLLPKPATGEEDEEDTGDNLVRHLLEYRQFKRAATELRSRQDEGSRLFVRPPTTVDLGELTQKPPEFGELDATLLQKALQRALARIPVLPPPPKVHSYTVTVAERIESVRSLLAEARKSAQPMLPLSFAGLLDESSSRLEIIVTFLAVLELIKQREVVARQDATFGEIVLLLADEDGPVNEGQNPADGENLATATEPEE
ncbi:MAG: segregation/condensation protein A [Caldilineaceae bacterium]|nr:segregation/condensation protein A [Caldilineaceae bacterium]